MTITFVPHIFCSRLFSNINSFMVRIVVILVKTSYFSSFDNNFVVSVEYVTI